MKGFQDTDTAHSQQSLKKISRLDLLKTVQQFQPQTNGGVTVSDPHISGGCFVPLWLFHVFSLNSEILTLPSGPDLTDAASSTSGRGLKPIRAVTAVLICPHTFVPAV